MRPALPVLAAALVVATNIGALGLGALNRRSVESEIVLTERELRVVRSDSVTSLRVTWMSSPPAALGGTMVTRAGFRTARAPSDAGAEEYYARQLQRQAYVALEHDGPAWARYREHLRRPAPLLPLDAVESQNRQAALAETIEGHTRLFAVDVDADAARLRARHPDRGRYLIAIARVNVALVPERGDAGSPRTPAVRVRVLEPSTINVPRPFSTPLGNLQQHPSSMYGDTLASAPRYSVRLRYGRFHEPWIVDVGLLR